MTRDHGASRRRVVVAFLLAPWIVASVLTLAVWVLSLIPTPDRQGGDEAAMMLAFTGVLYIGYLLCGVPLFLFMRARKLTRLPHFLLTGLLGGNLLLVIILIVSLTGGEHVSFDWIAATFAILLFSTVGILAAYVLWVLIYWAPASIRRSAGSDADRH